MLSREQYLLKCLEEECAEIAQRVSKSLRFGPHETQPGQPLNNVSRINLELNDLCAVIEMLNSEFGYRLKQDEKLISAKKVKIDQYYEYSASLGIVEPRK